MKKRLIDFLVCPSCNGDLLLKTKKSHKNEILEGTIYCKKCKHNFLITSGVPRFVSDTTKGFVKTELAFSEKWKKHHKNHQAKDWVKFQTNWLLRRFGWKTISNLKNFLKDAYTILDAGTGVGNSANLLSKNSFAEVFAIDASESVDFAYKKYGKQNNLHFLQADIRDLPFKKKFFDYIYSDQVLHHTKNTDSSFAYLTKFLTTTGKISIYVYNKKSPIREYVDDYIRKTTVNMSVDECMKFSKDMAILGRSLSRIKKKITIPHDIPLLGVKAGKYDVQRFIYWYFLKCFWDPNNNFERSVGVNFDWYYPKFAFRHTPREVKTWFKKNKLKITHFNEIESGISATGTKR